MRFYTGQHRYYCGIDLHARQMYVCIVNQEGAILVHRNIETDPTGFREWIAPYQDDLAVAVSSFTADRGFAWHVWPHQSAVELRVDAADALAQHGADRVFLGRQRAHRYQIHHSLWRQLAGE